MKLTSIQPRTIVALACLALPAATLAQTVALAVPTPVPAPADAFQVRYASNLDHGDSVVNVTNTGTLIVPNGFLGTGGNMCVNVYAFEPGETMIACCSCLITPNGLNSLSVKNDLLVNPLTPAVPTSIVIKLLASTPLNTGSGGSCNAASPGPGSLVPGLRAWGTTLHALPTNPVTYGVTETPFLNSTLSPAELTKLTTLCTFIQTNGSGFGICKSCRLGGLAPVK